MDRKGLMEEYSSIIASAIVTREGNPLEFNLPDGIPIQTFSIMCATILGAAATANAEVGGGEPDHVCVKSTTSTIMVVSAGPHKLLACVINNEDDFENVLNSMKDIASSME